MKKLISLLVVLAMLMSMAPAAFAEDGFGVGGYQKLVLGENVAVYVAETETALAQAAYFAWTAEEAGTLTIDFSDEDETTVWCDIMVTNDGQFVTQRTIDTFGGSASVPVEAGNIVTLQIEDYNWEDATFHFTASFAASDAGYEGSGTEDDPWIIESLPALVTGEFTEDEAADLDYMGHFYQYTATEACTLDWSDFSGCAMFVTVNGDIVFDFCDVAVGDVLLINAWCNTYTAGTYEFVLTTDSASAPDGTEEDPIYVDFVWNAANTVATATVTVPANTTYYFFTDDISDIYLYVDGEEFAYVPFNPWGGYVFALTNDTAAEATYELVASYKQGSYVMPYEMIVGEAFTVNIPENSDDIWYSWTAEEDGVLTITVEGENWLFYIENATTGDSTDTWYEVDGSVNTDSIEVRAGDVVMLKLGSQDDAWNFPATTLTITAEFEAGEVGGNEGGDGGDVGEGETLVIGENNLEAKDGESVEYVFVANKAGTLYITVRAYGYGGTDDKESLIELTNWATLTINGEQIDSLQESVEVAAGDVVTIVLTSVDGDSYFAKLQLSYDGFYEAPLGSEENPVVLDFEDCPTTTVEIPAGETVWYKLSGFDAAIMYIYGEDAFVVQSYWSMMMGFVEETITAENGVVTFTPGAEMIQIGNSGDTAATFEIKAEIPEGIYENPADLPVNEDSVTVELEENSNGYYFDWVATADGTLTVTVDGEYWTFVLNNLTQGIYSDSYAKAEGSENFITIEVKAGDEIMLNIGTLDIPGEWQYEFPADSITVTAVFTAGAGGDLVLGDVNGDGKVNTTDAKLIMQYELGLVEETELTVDAADVNGDGKVNTTDAKLIMQFELGLITAFPSAEEN